MRKIQILNMLSETQCISADKLADFFEVSKRTILRDMDSLLADGYPIEAVLGRYGGYKFEGGYKFRLDTLTQEQYNRLSHLVNVFAVHPGDANLQKTFAQHSWIQYDISGWNATDAALFSTIEHAIYTKQSYSFRYASAQGIISDRVVQPKGLVFKDRFWYLIAFDDGVEKMFKLKRIMTQLHEPSTEGSLCICTLNVMNSKIFKILDECSVHSIEAITPNESQVVFSVPYSEWLLDFILSFGSDAKVVEPPWLSDKIQKTIDEMIEIYAEKNTLG